MKIKGIEKRNFQEEENKKGERERKERKFLREEEG